MNQGATILSNLARSLCLAAALGFLALGHATFAQQSSAPAAADEFFAHSDWANAAQAYSQLTAADPQNALAWQNLGESLLQLRKFPESIQAFHRAADLNFRPLVNRINIARAYAAQGDHDAALRVLKEVAASGQGGRARPFIAGSTEFARYKDDAEFKKILDSIAPCRSPEYRQFDFWVGDWDVQDPAGNVVGHNLVTLEQDGCLIVEHWTASGGVQTGTSFNYYDIRDRRWHQLYLDNSGNAGAFPAMAGELKDSKMVLLTNEPNAPISRWTWYTLAPNKVRQMAEQSTDNQKTWQITWDSVYVKKPQ
jgi:tetratricopeptide (TPR) repeat protein